MTGPVDPNPDTCHYCAGPADGYYESVLRDTDQWYWRFGFCQKCIDRKALQPLDPVYYERKTEAPVVIVPEPEVNRKGQYSLF
jgi:hypothetical protein